MGKFDDYINVTAPIHSATVKGKLGNADEIFLEGDTQNVENEIKEINSRHEELNKKHDTLSSKHESLSRTVQGIAATGGASTANNVTYNNDISGLNAENAQDAIDEVSSKLIYDVSARNNGAVFKSLQSLLSSDNLNTLIPSAVRWAGMSIRFIHSSDNKYVQYRYMDSNTTDATFTNVANWQGVDEEPTAGSNNLVKSGGVAKMQSVFNVNLYNNVPNTPYTTDGNNTAKEVARLAVPEQFRKFGLIITYLLEDGWVIERNNYMGTGNIVSDSIWKRDTTINTRSWITLVDAQDGIFNVNYHLLNNNPITMEEALQASLDTGMKTSARCISYLSEEGAVIAIFNKYISEITNANWLNPENWLILGGYDYNASKLSYYEFNGTIEDVGVNTYVIYKKPFSGTKVLINVLSGDYTKIVIRATPLDGGNDIYHSPASSIEEYNFAKEIKYINVYVRTNSSGSYSVAISGGMALDVKQLKDTTSSVTNIVNSLQGNIKSIQDDVETLERTTELLNDTVMTEESKIVDIPLTIHTVDNLNGYWYYKYGTWSSDDTRRSTEKIDVLEGEKYLITTNIGGSVSIAYLAQWNGDTWVGVSNDFKGGSGNAVDREYIVPNGVTKIAICSYNTKSPSLKKVTSSQMFKAYSKEESDEKYYSKEESDEKYAPISTTKEIKRYGVKWSITNSEDLGARCFDAIGLSAEIAIGSTGGYSDFDNIYPWSDMKRCNILSNANGAKVVTFEGEAGFALDGSNGDVFVRIPKFSVEKYVKDGEEYRVISNDSGHIHPAFIEDGKVLDEIFISAFEASENGGKLYSKGGAIPANNITAETFLNYAKAKGICYSLFDNRCVDLLFTLMAVEYGCRNSNRILGYGYSGYIQAAQYQTWSHCSVSSPSTNTITLGKPSSNYERLAVLEALAVGQNICICGNAHDGRQTNILAQRKIISTSCPTIDDSFVVVFDGAPIAVDAEVEGNTNYTYVGNAPSTCNNCETITDNGAAMTYHTGRTKRKLSPIGEIQHETANACRYRWIENPIGNVWHFLPDMTFVNGQMYICENMRDYVCHKYTSPYKPIGKILATQMSNGNKSDIANANYWISSLMNDIFAKGSVFGNAWDTSLVSTKAFGAYYYLSSKNTPVIISHGGGFDHLYRCNILTQRAWQEADQKWYLYGGRLMFKNI